MVEDVEVAQAAVIPDSLFKYLNPIKRKGLSGNGSHKIGRSNSK